MGVLNVSLTGGEIFLREDLFDIIEYARNLYMRVFLLSNATLLNEQIVARPADLSIANFSTSIYSLDENVHDNITGKKGSLKSTLKNIQLLKEYNIEVAEEKNN